MREQFLATLKKYWGYDSFRPMQLDVIESVFGGKDTLALMPTGAGKSILYQLPAMCMDGVCVVVTPLIALMKDQVDRLKSIGITAVAVHSGLSARQIDIALDNCVYGDVKFLYIAPERISSEIFRLRAMRMKIAMVAIDEAHCISQWGYDFRPSYLKIIDIRKHAPDAVFIALTASATDSVIADIQSRLGFRNGVVVRTSFARANLSYAVRNAENKQDQLLRIVNNVSGTGIVYVRTRDGAEQVARWLSEQGITADYYHGGLTYMPRSEKQEAWVRGRSRIMVATNAFGMGIDKADVRFVIHYDACDSLEAYYQEAGRAGRDGQRAYAVLLMSPDERSRARTRFATGFPPMDHIKRCYEALFNFYQIAIGDGKFAAFEFDLFGFTQRFKMFGGAVINSIKILQQNGYMTLTDAADHPPRVMFMVGRDDLYRIRVDRGDLDHILRIILRLYEGVFHNFVPIDISEMAVMSGYEPRRVKELLKKLWELRVIRYIPASVSPLIILNEERLPIEDVVISPESYRMRKDNAIARLEAFYDYADNDQECRSVMLQHYFGEQDAESCGCCDVCLERKRQAKGVPKDLSTKILDAVAEKPLTVKELVSLFKGDPSEITALIDALLGENKIYVDNSGKIGKFASSK